MSRNRRILEASARLAMTALATAVWLAGAIPGAGAEAPGDLTLVSISSLGKGNDESEYPSLSLDGRFVVFASHATNLHPADTDDIADIYVKDLVTGRIGLVSTSSNGTKGNWDSYTPTISDNGTRVAFFSQSDNIHPRDNDTLPDIYVKNLRTGRLSLASMTAAGVKTNGSNYNPVISGDGSAVAFNSLATNVDPRDTDGFEDIYVKDLAAGELILASTSASGQKGQYFSLYPSLSHDGTRVAFYALSPFDPRDTDLSYDVYVKDLVSGQMRLASTSDTGRKANHNSFAPDLSADGTIVAFDSNASNLDPADRDETSDVYVKNLVTGDIKLASTSDTGSKANSFSYDPALAGDGRSVAFLSTATNLDGADRDTLPDLFVKDLATNQLTLASASDAGVSSNHETSSSAISADGSMAGFQSLATNLDPADTDFTPDVYVKEL